MLISQEYLTEASVPVVTVLVNMGVLESCFVMCPVLMVMLAVTVVETQQTLSTE